MRDIRFRQWNPRTKRMQVGVGCFDGTWVGFEYVSWDRFPVMQFTGKIDRNGKEVYEGDLAMLKDHTSLYRCEWNSERCVFIWQCVFADERRWMIEECEVIGNVFENPELLEKG